ncbi:MAG: cell division protein ZapA [Deltaproteobacteria bacterium]|jgi:cell division protein ZapA|nr:cell division protein ZapA [Deltaproteobacteria bacterium]
MQSFTINVLGLELSFKANADPAKLEQAKQMLDKRFEILKQHGGHLSKEKLLAFLALALADDLLVLTEKLDTADERTREIMRKIEMGLNL